MDGTVDRRLAAIETIDKTRLPVSFLRVVSTSPFRTIYEASALRSSVIDNLAILLSVGFYFSSPSLFTSGEHTQSRTWIGKIWT